MEMDKFEDLKNIFQEVIDFISQKNAEYAQIKLTIAADMLNEMLDLTITDDELITMRQYQMLHRQLEEIIALLN
jgi:hypothetical protein